MQDKFKYRLFGRTRGRSKKKIDLNNYYKLISESKIKKLDENNNYILDIGTGYGETSIYFSAKYKNYKVITCEKYINGNIYLLDKIKKFKIKNIYVNDCNVHQILDNYKEKKYFNLILIFFPDPWPKKKHIGRRLIDVNFLKKIYSYIKESGKVIIATDSTSYTKDLISYFYILKDIYEWTNQNKIYLDIKDFFNFETKYYRKAINSGRKSNIFVLRKL